MSAPALPGVGGITKSDEAANIPPHSAPPQALVLYDEACRALAQAKSVDEVRHIRDQSEALRQCARVAKNRQLEIDAAEIRFRAERRLGEFMQAGREAGEIAEGRPAKNGSDHDPFPRVTLDEAGIGKHLADRARKYAAVPHHEFEASIDSWKASLAQEDRVTVDLLKPGTHTLRVMGSSQSVQWYTPPHIVDLAVATLGEIDLDPCWHPDSPVRATTTYTAADDGLAQPWAGRVYMNPPFGDGIDDWVAKLVDEHERGNVTEAVPLVPARVDTRWFRRLDPFPRCFVWGRLMFSNSENTAPFPVAIPYLGHNIGYFAKIFGAVGGIWVQYEAAR
jgi:hypothetical protein